MILYVTWNSSSLQLNLKFKKNMDYHATFNHQKILIMLENIIVL